MATNPLLALIAPALTSVVEQIQTAANSITATPTIENVTTQLEELALDAINPAKLEGVSIGGAAQEVSNVAGNLLAHLNSAAAAPTAAALPAA